MKSGSGGMTGRAFIDTNVLIYAFDYHAPAKAEMSGRILGEAEKHGRGVISTQVLAEFFVNVTRRLATPLSEDRAARAIEDLATVCSVETVDEAVVMAALGARQRYGLHYWDAQIWATAHRSGCTTILTEDVPGRPEIEGVAYVDPFADDFDPETLFAR